MEKGAPILAVRGSETVQALLLWAIPTVVHPEKSELLLEELHEGICGSHTRGRSLSHRAITQGYWWPNMQKEAQEYGKKCDQCQRFAPNIHQPGGVFNPLSSPWPFA